MKDLGRRLERLLLLSAPITVAASLLLFVSMANIRQQERAAARCFLNAAGVITKHKVELIDLHPKDTPEKSNPFSWLPYFNKLTEILIYQGSGDCFDVTDSQVNKLRQGDVDQMIQALTKIGQEFSAQPLRFAGVEVPEITSVTSWEQMSNSIWRL